MQGNSGGGGEEAETEEGEEGVRADPRLGRLQYLNIRLEMLTPIQ